ncbi:hypothetical protein AcV7_002735 [Taiwanofungus camphoratus]|nr:hypothetical protein AcV7_002735 [Antrodia cinnamomea]
MAPRNATTPLSPLSPDPDQAPGLSRTPSFLKFTPQARHGLVRQPRRTRKLRGAPRRGPQDRLARTGASDPSSCRTCGSVSSMAEGAASVRLPAFSSVANLDVFALSNARGGRLGVRYPLGCQSAPAHDPNRQRAEHAVFGPESFRLAAMLGRGAPTPPARARSSATPFSIPRPLPWTLPSLTTPSRPRPAPLDGRADAPGVAVQANAAMMLRAGGRACESLREARAGDRDRAAGVEGETVLTVSPSPLPTVRDPCATIPPTAYLIQPSTARDWQPPQTRHVRKRRTASRADEFQRRAQTIRAQCQSAPVPALAGRRRTAFDVNARRDTAVGWMSR